MRARGALLALLAVFGGVVIPRPVAAGPRDQPVRVVASFYPLAWAAQETGGERVRVTDLTPSGAEPHDLELTVDDRAAIEKADLMIVLGGGFQPAVEEAAEQRDGPTLVIIDELNRRERVRARRDPHVWLDPIVMVQVVEAVSHALPARAGVRFDALPAAIQLDLLDEEFRAGLADCERDVVVTAHEAFGWLARRYGLRQEGIAGIDPDAEPNPQRVADLAELVREEGVTTIFTEDLVSPKVAETLAREAGGVSTEVLSPLESLTAAQREGDDDYVTVMRANLEKLRDALGCR